MCYWKLKNVAKVKIQFRRKFQTDLPLRLTIARIGIKLEADVIIQNIQKQSSGKIRDQQQTIVETYVENSRKCVRHVAREVGRSESSNHRILKRLNSKSYAPRLVHILKEHDQKKESVVVYTFLGHPVYPTSPDIAVVSGVVT